MSLFRRKDWLNYSQQPGKIQISVCLLMKIIQSDWPEHRKEVPANLQLYFPFREELSILNGLIFKTKRTVIPAIGKTRESIMQALHKSHTGLQGCLRRAREVVYWPGLHTDLERFLSQCEPCQTFKKEPNQRTTSESSDTRHVTPYQRSMSVITLEDFFFLRLDLMDYAGKGYLVTVDYSSNFFEVDRLQDKAAEEVI